MFMDNKFINSQVQFYEGVQDAPRRQRITSFHIEKKRDNHFRKSYIQVTSKSKETGRKKSLLNLTISTKNLYSVKEKENRISIHNPLKLNRKTNQKKSEGKKVHKMPIDYLVRMEIENAQQNEDEADSPFFWWWFIVFQIAFKIHRVLR